MTTSNTSGAASMRFSSDEVLSGMLGSTLADSFTDDATQLAAMFNDPRNGSPSLNLWEDGNAVGAALEKLVLQKRYSIRRVNMWRGSEPLREQQTNAVSKDVQQLEEAARVFDGL